MATVNLQGCGSCAQRAHPSQRQVELRLVQSLQPRHGQAHKVVVVATRDKIIGDDDPHPCVYGFPRRAHMWVTEERTEIRDAQKRVQQPVSRR